MRLTIARALSDDLRGRVLKASTDGLSALQTAARFGRYRRRSGGLRVQNCATCRPPASTSTRSDGLRQTQGPIAQSRRVKRRRPLARHLHHNGPLRAQGMLKLLHGRRTGCNLIGKCSRRPDRFSRARSCMLCAAPYTGGRMITELEVDSYAQRPRQQI